MNKTIINLLLVAMFLMSSIPLGFAQPKSDSDVERFAKDFKPQVDYSETENFDIDDTEFSTDYIPEEVKLDGRFLVVGRILGRWFERNERKLGEKYCPRDNSKAELAKLDEGAQVVVDAFKKTEEQNANSKSKRFDKASLQNLKEEFNKYCSLPPEEQCKKFAEKFAPKGPKGKKITLTCPPNKEDFLNECKANIEEIKEKMKSQAEESCTKQFTRESKQFDRMCEFQKLEEAKSKCNPETQYFDFREKTCKERPTWPREGNEGQPRDWQPHDKRFEQPKCGDGICNEEPSTCRDDCGGFTQPQPGQVNCEEQGKTTCRNEKGELYCNQGSCPQPSTGGTTECSSPNVKCTSPDGHTYCATSCSTGTTGPVCGNASCESSLGESSSTCPADCGTTQPPSGGTQPPNGTQPPAGTSSNESLNAVASFQPNPEDFERFRREGGSKGRDFDPRGGEDFGNRPDFGNGEGRDFGPGDDFPRGPVDGFGPESGEQRGYKEHGMNPEQACENGQFKSDKLISACKQNVEQNIGERLSDMEERCGEQIEHRIEGAERYCDQQEECAAGLEERCSFLKEQNDAVQALLADKANGYPELKELVKEEFGHRCRLEYGDLKEFSEDKVVKGINERNLGSDELNSAARNEATEVAELKSQIKELNNQLAEQQKQLNTLTSILKSLFGDKDSVDVGIKLQQRAEELDKKIATLKELANQASSENEKTAFLSTIAQLTKEKEEVEKQAKENTDKVGILGAIGSLFTGKATLVPTPFN